MANTSQIFRKLFTVALASLALVAPASAMSDDEVNAIINQTIDSMYVVTSTPGLLRFRHAPGTFVGQLANGKEIFIAVKSKDSDGDFYVGTVSNDAIERSFYVSCSRDQIAEEGSNEWKKVDHNTAEGYITDAACKN